MSSMCNKLQDLGVVVVAAVRDDPVDPALVLQFCSPRLAAEDPVRKEPDGRENAGFADGPSNRPGKLQQRLGDETRAPRPIEQLQPRLDKRLEPRGQLLLLLRQT